MALSKISGDLVPYCSGIPEWFSRVKPLGNIVATAVTKMVAANIMARTRKHHWERRIWECPYWIDLKKELAIFPEDIRLLLGNTTMSRLKKTLRANGMSLFACWWIFFREDHDKSIDVPEYDDDILFGALVDYLGNVSTKTKSLNTIIPVDLGDLSRIAQKQEQLESIRIHPDIDPHQLMSFAQCLKLDSATFEHFENMEWAGHGLDLVPFLALQQDTLTTFRFPSGRFIFNVPSIHEGTEVLLSKLQFLEIDASELGKIPDAACKTITRLKLHLSEDFEKETDKRMTSLKELEINFRQPARVNLGFCKIFENQLDVGPLQLTIEAEIARWTQILLAQIPNIQKAYIYKNCSDKCEDFLPPHMPLLEEFGGLFSKKLFRSIQNCPNLKKLVLRCNGFYADKIKDLISMHQNEMQFNVKEVVIRTIDWGREKLTISLVFKFFIHLKNCFPPLEKLQIEGKFDINDMKIELTANVIRKVSNQGFKLEISQWKNGLQKDCRYCVRFTMTKNS